MFVETPTTEEDVGARKDAGALSKIRKFFNGRIIHSYSALFRNSRSDHAAAHTE